MTAADGLLALLLFGITAYTVTAGADLGAGIWHLVARGEWADRERALVEKEMGPVWEANQVWLVHAVILVFTGFPIAFALISRALLLPLLLALLALVLRGSAFVFLPHRGRGWRLTFGLSSVAVPALLGLAVASTATGRLRHGSGVFAAVSPLPLLAGVLAVLTCAYLGAVYLTRDAVREGDDDLAARFRRRALVTAVLTGVVAIAGIPVLQSDAPVVAAGFRDDGLPLAALSVLSGGTALVLMWRHHYVAARVAAAAAPAALLAGWGVGQYPWLLVDTLRAEDATAPGGIAAYVLGVLLAGAVIVVPSLVLLVAVFQRPLPRIAPDVRVANTPRV